MFCNRLELKNRLNLERSMTVAVVGGAYDRTDWEDTFETGYYE
jgi:hypothetical protein